jgi:hypothetical protein
MDSSFSPGRVSNRAGSDGNFIIGVAHPFELAIARANAPPGLQNNAALAAETANLVYSRSVGPGTPSPSDGGGRQGGLGEPLSRPVLHDDHSIDDTLQSSALQLAPSCARSGQPRIDVPNCDEPEVEVKGVTAVGLQSTVDEAGFRDFLLASRAGSNEPLQYEPNGPLVLWSGLPRNNTVPYGSQVFGAVSPVTEWFVDLFWRHCANVAGSSTLRREYGPHAKITSTLQYCQIPRVRSSAAGIKAMRPFRPQ